MALTFYQGQTQYTEGQTINVEASGVFAIGYASFTLFISISGIQQQDTSVNLGTGSNYYLRYNVYTPANGAWSRKFSIPLISDGVTEGIEYITISLRDGSSITASIADPIDTTPPTISTITYGTNDGALALGEAVTLTVTLSEAVNVTLSEAVNVTGTPALALANGGAATYTGGTGTGTLTFSYTPAAGQTTADLATAASAALTGTINDLAGNAVTAAGFNNVNPTGTLAVDVTAPTVSTFTPADGATDVAVGANIVLSFSEAIARGTGTITLRSGSATGTIVESFDAANSNRLTVSGSTLTIDPTSNLARDTSYFVTFASDAIRDLAGNAYAGTTSYDFRTTALAQGVTVAGTSGNDVLSGTQNSDVIQGLAGNDTINGGVGVDTAIVSGLRAAYTVTQTSTGVWSVSGPDGTDTLSNIEYLKFDDQTIRPLPGTGTSVNFLTDSPATFMSGIRDFDGNDIGASSGWKWIGAVDVNGDGDVDQIFVNRANGRFAEVGTASDGKVYFRAVFDRSES